jgi:hypothetical protein
MLRPLVLAKYLQGIKSPALIAQACNTPDAAGEIDAYLRSAEFLTSLARAKKDMAASVLDAIRDQLHTFLDEYMDLALNSNDPRVRAAVLKDLLDRGGTGATAKVALTTPDMYRKAIEEYIEPHENPAVDSSPAASSDKPGSETK